MVIPPFNSDGDKAWGGEKLTTLTISFKFLYLYYKPFSGDGQGNITKLLKNCLKEVN